MQISTPPPSTVPLVPPSSPNLPGDISEDPFTQQVGPVSNGFEGFAIPNIDYPHRLYNKKKTIIGFFMQQFEKLRGGTMSAKDKKCVQQILDTVLDKLPTFAQKYFSKTYILFCKKEINIQIKTIQDVFRNKTLLSTHDIQDSLYYQYILKYGSDDSLTQSMVYFFLLLRIMYDFLGILNFHPNPKKTINLPIGIYFILIIEIYSFFWVVENQQQIRNMLIKYKRPLQRFIDSKEIINPTHVKRALQDFKQQHGGGGGGYGGDYDQQQQQKTQQQKESCYNMNVGGEVTLYDMFLVVALYMSRLQTLQPNFYKLLVYQPVNQKLYEKVFKYKPEKQPFSFEVDTGSTFYRDEFDILERSLIL